MMARIGGLLAPLTLEGALRTLMKIFGGLALMSAFLSFLLSETKGKIMADILDS